MRTALIPYYPLNWRCSGSVTKTSVDKPICRFSVLLLRNHAEASAQVMVPSFQKLFSWFLATAYCPASLDLLNLLLCPGLFQISAPHKKLGLALSLPGLSSHNSPGRPQRFLTFLASPDVASKLSLWISHCLPDFSDVRSKCDTSKVKLVVFLSIVCFLCTFFVH